MDKKTLHKLFSRAFDDAQWLEVLQSVFGAKHGLLVQPKDITANLKGNHASKATAAFELGSFTTSDDRIIGLYKIELKPDVWLERNKAGLRELLRDVYKYDVDGAIIVFVQDKKWRLSFVSEIKMLNDEGEVIEQATEPKRYTYLLGESEKVRTPSERLAALSNKTLSIQDILNAFSVEALNEEFYKIIQAFFYELVGGKVGKGRKQTDYGKGVLQLPGVPKDNRQVYQEFAVRLIGRSVFCWFLKMKKSDEAKPLLPESLLASKAVKAHPNYYHSILERVFFQTLNTPMDKRVDNLPEGAEQVPFLNGGLFEPGTDDYYKPNRLTGLNEHLNTLKIPDSWFQVFFEELEKYNFTIDENSVTDVEVSVDPEMLGRIFENLLAEIDPDSGETARKATGSFYTPREIVDYMATESLVQYLHNKTGIVHDKLRPIFKMLEAKDPKFTPAENNCILDALDKVKILDPACGSGAFPMGVLQKIVQVLQKLDPEADWWKQRQVNRIGNAIVKKQLKEKLDSSGVEYARKIGIIQNSLYGVDIQPVAAEISKLRCFLTLIVDEHIDESKPNRGIEPLPNLEFKFVTADTLISLEEDKSTKQGQVGVLSMDFGQTHELQDKLIGIRNRYLQAYGEEKDQLKKEFLAIQKEIFKEEIARGGQSTRSLQLANWNPFGHDRSDWFDPKWMFGLERFDIVIGNPPYVQMQKDKGLLAEKYADSHYHTYQRTGDIYALFYERGLNLLNATGNLNFITSDKWMRAAYGKSLRKFFSQRNPLILVLLGEHAFKTATVNTNILLIENKPVKNINMMAAEIKISNDGFNAYCLSFHPLSEVSEKPWIVLDESQARIRQKIKSIGNTLKQSTKFSIKYGIKTGLNEAFIINTDKKEKLGILDGTKDAEIVKKVLSGKDIKRYKYSWNNEWIITTFPSIKLEINEYPMVKKYLNTFGKRLVQSGEKGSRKKTRHKWFETQDNIAYYKKFEEPKIVWGNLAKSAQFALAPAGMYINAPSPLITPAKNYLLGILNSKVADFYIRLLGVVRAGGYFEYKPMFIEQLPIPSLTTAEKYIMDIVVGYVLWLHAEKRELNPHVPNSHIAQLFEEVIDAMVMELYFKEDFQQVDIEFIKFAERDFASIEGKPEAEQIEIIHRAYQKLREKGNEIRNNLKLMDIKLADIVLPIKAAK